MAVCLSCRYSIMNEPLLILLWQAISFAAFNIALRAILRLPLISAAFAFWVGWIFLLTGGVISEKNEWATINTYFSPYLETLFWGALLGFSLASVLSLIQKPRPKYSNLVKIAGMFFDKFGTKVLVILFVVGSIFLAQRVAMVGFSSNYLTDVRTIYNEGTESLLLRLGSHLSVLMIMFIILRGVYDSHFGVNTRMIILVILCGAPIGLASGGRMFLLSYLMAYLGSFFLCRSHFSGKKLFVTLAEAKSITAIFIGLLLVFAIMGFTRGGYGSELDILYTIIIWPVSTLFAMDSWVSVAISSPNTYGFNTFGWFFDIFSRFDFLDLSGANDTMTRSLKYFEITANSAAVIPRSILPDLIFDFGVDALFYSMVSVAFVLEFITSRFAGHGIFLHVAATQCLIASFSTIQNSVVTPGFAVTIFWAAVFSLLAARYGWRK